ncbi:MAG: methylenetetrahydrofolate reductase [Dehalococcoidia bacterium]
MHLREKLRKQFAVTTELGGTNGTDIARSLEDVRSYLHIDGLNVIDCASARLRTNSFALAHLIQSDFPELDVVPHLTCRDRSILGLQADLLGAHGLGIRYVLATTGDPPKEGPYKDSKAVYNTTSVRLIRTVNDLNRGLDYNGERIEGETDFFVSAVAAPGAGNLGAVIKRMKTKIEAGANFFQTQPMYDVEKTKDFLSKAKELGVPILLGIMPLRGLRMAEYMNEKVAGIDIPEEVIERIRGGVKGTEIAKEFIREIHGHEGLSGIHIMALGDVNATNEVIGFIRSLS